MILMNILIANQSVVMSVYFMDAISVPSINVIAVCHGVFRECHQYLIEIYGLRTVIIK